MLVLIMMFSIRKSRQNLKLWDKHADVSTFSLCGIIDPQYVNVFQQKMVCT